MKRVLVVIENGRPVAATTVEQRAQSIARQLRRKGTATAVSLWELPLDEEKWSQAGRRLVVRAGR